MKERIKAIFHPRELEDDGLYALGDNKTYAERTFTAKGEHSILIYRGLVPFEVQWKDGENYLTVTMLCAEGGKADQEYDELVADMCDTCTDMWNPLVAESESYIRYGWYKTAKITYWWEIEEDNL